MTNLKIKLNDNLTLGGVVTSVTINKNELIIGSSEQISWASAESLAKHLIGKGYKQISKITFKELITF
jgi:arginine deiminase